MSDYILCGRDFQVLGLEENRSSPNLTTFGGGGYE
jgi:hypothetical protein